MTELLPTARNTLLEQRLQQRKLKNLAALKNTIPPRRQASPAPLSYAQEGVWYLEQLTPDVASYNMPFAWRLRGALDLVALERSLNAIVQRHEVLRTSFQAIDGQPVQVIAPDLTLAIHLVDLQHLPAADRATQTAALLDQEVRQPFDLTQAPLLRVTLMRLDREEHLFVLNLHHIIGDGWSFSLLTQELSTFYAAFAAKQPAPSLPPLPIQYADFAAWQRAEAASGAFADHLAYWRQQLEGAPPILEAPADFPRPARQSYQGERLNLTLPESLSSALKSLSDEAGVTLFVTLLSAFKILLQRYTGQDDLIVGAPLATRAQPELEGLIGYFLNNLVLRTDLSGPLTFRELLRRVGDTTLAAYSHQVVPFEKLVQELRLQRNLSYTPLFQVFFNMYNFGLDKLELAGLAVENVATHGLEPGSKFDITLYAQATTTTVDLQLAYRTDLFRRERMCEMLNQYEQLLTQIIAAPDQNIADYSLLTPAARERLPDPGQPLAEPVHEPITTMIAHWAKQTPDRPALSQGRRTWSYGELIERAETIARALRAAGLAQEETVAVSGSRSFGLIAGMVGVFLSGGVLLLLDPNLPLERQKLMIREARVKALIRLQGEPAAPLYPAAQGPDGLDLEVDPATGRLDPAGTGRPAAALPELKPDDPAYIFFTSGTTGTPKGVLGCHKGLSHFLRWQGETFNIRPEDRAAQLTGLSFDVVLRDIFLALTRGATLCLPETRHIPDSAELLGWLERERISLLHTVPALAQAWLSEAPASPLPQLRWAFFAGEPLTDVMVRQWRKVFPNCEIINLYGPTETTLAKCYYHVPADPPPGVQPVGRPMPQTQALIMAGANRRCGLNEPGEIVLRTPFRSLGYINAPAETGQRFVKNPFRDDDWDWLYYTGDRGCYRSDGLLEILGRLDDQIKIRGVRVEPGEVSTLLAQHPGVKTCAVIAHKDPDQQAQLVAYVVPQAPDGPPASELRAYLSRRVPPALVPAAVVMLNSLPLTANGKLDRKRLPAPAEFSPQGDIHFTAPEGAVEQMLAQIWQEVLGLEAIGVHDNFFQLGGHSLLATRIISKIRQEYDFELPLRNLFELPTIAELAPVIEEILVNEPGK